MRFNPVDAQDAVAELALSRYELRLAKALSHVVNILIRCHCAGRRYE